jgi:hypothetical protein
MAWSCRLPRGAHENRGGQTREGGWIRGRENGFEGATSRATRRELERERETSCRGRENGSSRANRKRAEHARAEHARGATPREGAGSGPVRSRGLSRGTRVPDPVKPWRRAGAGCGGVWWGRGGGVTSGLARKEGVDGRAGGRVGGEWGAREREGFGWARGSVGPG